MVIFSQDFDVEPYRGWSRVLVMRRYPKLNIETIKAKDMRDEIVTMYNDLMDHCKYLEKNVTRTDWINESIPFLHLHRFRSIGESIWDSFEDNYKRSVPGVGKAFSLNFALAVMEHVKVIMAQYYKVMRKYVENRKKLGMGLSDGSHNKITPYAEHKCSGGFEVSIGAGEEYFIMMYQSEEEFKALKDKPITHSIWPTLDFKKFE